jgi:NAD(P)-dependent dehydrogenase (short-subunit alcohol dehydrogenase family)
MNWADTSVLITGGSRGLGYALAEALGRRGARLALVGLHEQRLAGALARLEGARIRAHGIRADVGDKHAIHRIAGEAQALIGPIDVLIHNASTLGPLPLAPLLDTPCEDFARALEVNVLGSFRLTKAIAAGMLVRGRGLIVHVSSDAAIESYPTWGAYGVSKAALDHLARHFAVELADTKLRVISVDPGEMDTDMHRDAVKTADPSTLSSPSVVAERMVRVFEQEARYPSGVRVRAADVTEVVS